MESLTQAQIESIVFEPIGFARFPYKLKALENIHPMQNVAGCIMINGIYYKEATILSQVPETKKEQP